MTGLAITEAGESLSVSVALATYNGERYLRDQLNSLASQAALPDELVITDDCSTDGSVALVRDWSATAPFPVTVSVNPERLGYRSNFRRAANLCSSDLIFFADQDDIWLPNKIRRVVAAVGPETLLVYHGALLVDQDGKMLGQLHDYAEQRAKLASIPLPPWHFSHGLVQAFRRELLAYDAFWDQGYDHYTGTDIVAHDQWYFFLAMALGEVRYVPEDLLLYRQHATNTFGTKYRTKYQKLVDRFVHEGWADRNAAIAAARRSDILMSIAELRADGEGSKILSMARAYGRLAGKLQRRHETFCAEWPGRRFASLCKSIAAGDYHDYPWGFDVRSIPRDVIAGVLKGQARKGQSE